MKETIKLEDYQEEMVRRLSIYKNKTREEIVQECFNFGIVALFAIEIEAKR